MYVGEDLPPVPTKQAQQIWQWDFMGMAETLPGLWARRNDEGTDNLGIAKSSCN